MPDRDTPPTSARYGGWGAVAALAAAGALLRLVGLCAARYDDVDTTGLYTLAGDLAAGAGLAARDLAYWPPLPSALTALLAGVGVPVRPAGQAVITLAGALTAFPAAWLGRALGGRGAMLWAAAGAALLPSLVIAAQRFHAEPVAGLFLLSAAALAPATRWARPALAAFTCGLLGALAWLSRFELLAAVPLLVGAVALLPPARPARARLALAGLALLGFALLALPYAGLLHQLGHGFSLIPGGRVNANLAFTLSGNQVSYGLPGAPEAAADAVGAVGDAWDRRRALVEHVLRHTVQPSLWRAILRMVTPAVLVLAAAELLRRADPEARRLRALLLALGLPALAALVIVDDISRYWTTWALLALPLAAATLARRSRARLSPLLAPGLLALPAAVSPDAPMPIRAPGESPRALLVALLDGQLDLELLGSPAGAWLALAVPPLCLLVVVGALVAVVAPRGPRLTLPLLGLAGATSLLQLHFEHLRASSPPCHFQENIALLGVAADCRVAATWSLDGYVLGEASELPDGGAPGVWVPTPRASLSPERQRRWWEAQRPDLLVVDAADPPGSPIAIEVARGALPLVAQSPAEQPHLRVYAATPAGLACAARWSRWQERLGGRPFVPGQADPPRPGEAP